MEFIARITVTDTKQLIVEPALNSDEGIVLETKFGDFTVKIRFGDKEEDAENKMIEMARGSRKMRASVVRFFFFFSNRIVARPKLLARCQVSENQELVFPVKHSGI